LRRLRSLKETISGTGGSWLSSLEIVTLHASISDEIRGRGLPKTAIGIECAVSSQYFERFILLVASLHGQNRTIALKFTLNLVITKSVVLQFVDGSLCKSTILEDSYYSGSISRHESSPFVKRFML
jgi:hypothetical protein